MDESMFVLSRSGGLLEMFRQGFPTEDEFQQLLAEHLQLMRGAGSGETRRWLLIRREAGIPDEAYASDRWSMDHLLLDQDAVPTLVEVKRSTDTRIRREVVGQMLDYAANAVLYLPVERLRAWFEELAGESAAERLAEVAGSDVDPDRYWEMARTNIQAGKIRLVFVADVIPRELQRIVEFLNGQMNPAEVLAVELQQFVGEGMQTLVPRVIGHTAGAQRVKSEPSGRRQWDEDSFFADLVARRGVAEGEVARSLLGWARRRTSRITWGTGEKSGSFTPVIDQGRIQHEMLIVNSSGYLSIPFGYMAKRPPFTDGDLRRAFARRLIDAGVPLPDDSGEEWPNVKLHVFLDGALLQRFIGVLDWVVDVIGTASAVDSSIPEVRP